MTNWSLYALPQRNLEGVLAHVLALHLALPQRVSLLGRAASSASCGSQIGLSGQNHRVKKPVANPVVARNRKAAHDYHLGESWEAEIVLQRGIGGDFDDDLGLDLDHRGLAASAPVGADLFRPRMAGTSRPQQRSDWEQALSLRCGILAGRSRRETISR
ncbi:hypothetical protein ACFPJ1_21300 [Kribbella qitaiheensis]|uniref:hypothetical protein n=1 Tax=Kribbella qitaiheensis TaxID=1544730 RepID=UPI00361FFB26